MDTNWFKQR